jgi:DNA recombination protein RmuC
MDPLHVILGLLASLFALAALWLLRERWRLAAERDVSRARLADEEALKQGFQAVASEVLKSSNAEFLRLAQSALAVQTTQGAAELDKRRESFARLIEPIQKALEKTHEELRRVEKESTGLRGDVVRMAQAHQELRAETGKLSQALAKPNVRGRYGEIQLERVVELSGMRSYCDFATQTSVRSAEGDLKRPDVVVRLPNERVIAIDAKTSFDAYMAALDAGAKEERERHLERYALHVVEQVKRLADKRYWSEFEESPEFVVLFIPGDQLVDAALERRPDLIDLAAQKNVVLASPATLIGLLRAVHIGWRERNLSESAEELFQLGKELHERARVVLERAAKVGDSIDAARRDYNQFVGSVQGRLMPTLRKFEEKDARSGRDLIVPRPLEGETRRLDAGLLFDDVEEPELPARVPRTQG